MTPENMRDSALELFNTRVNWRDPSAVKVYFTSPDSRRKICAQLVGDVAEALGKLVDKETPR